MTHTENVIGPQRGPQTRFLASSADIAIFGGSAGSGKTFAALLAAGQWVDRRGYAAVIFRRTSPELIGGGSLWEESQPLYRALGGACRSHPSLDWRFPSGALVEMRHLQHADDVYAHQGKQYACVVFDELTHFDESQFWYLVSRLRSTCGVRPHVRATCNPDPDSFVRKLIGWWLDDSGYPIPERSGALRWFVRSGDDLVWGDTREEVEAGTSQRALSLTFVPAKLEDNQLGDPSYRDRLLSLPLVQRQRLLDGNWNARAGSGTVFRREHFVRVDSAQIARTSIVRSVRGWDKAASEATSSRPDPDWTRGVRVSYLSDGRMLIDDVVSLRATPGRVLEAMRRTAEQDGHGVTVALWQDPGQAGVVDVDATMRELMGYSCRAHKATSDKLTNAYRWSAWVERQRVMVANGPWTDAFLAECEAFPDGAHDDQIDAVSVAVSELGDINSTGSIVYTPAKREPRIKPWDVGGYR